MNRLSRLPAAPRRLLRCCLPAALLLAATAAQAQAFRCPGERPGQWLYTDQPCPGGALIAPAPTPQMQQAQQNAADQAHERQARSQTQAAQREQQRQAADWQDAQQRALLRPQPHETAECRAARLEADFRARSVTATEEQIRTARYNAALACGQPPPQEVVIVQPAPLLPPAAVAYPPPYPYPPQPGLAIRGHLNIGAPPPLPPYGHWPGARPNRRHDAGADPAWSSAPAFGRPVHRHPPARAMGIGPSAGIRSGMNQHEPPTPVLIHPGRQTAPRQ